MPWANPSAPNLADYTSFVYSVIETPATLPLVPLPLTSLTWLSGVATATAASPLPYVAGALLSTTIAGAVPAGFNAVGATGTVTSPTTFTYAISAPGGTESTPGTFTVPPQVVFDSLWVALQIVNPALNVGGYSLCPPPVVGPSPPQPQPQNTSPSVYVYAVYNLATDRLFNFAPDVQGQTYFADQRAKMRIADVSLGVVNAASDQGTAGGWLNPEQMRLFTLQDLQTLKTPWGRQYMAYAQMYGRTLWGLT